MSTDPHAQAMAAMERIAEEQATQREQRLQFPDFPLIDVASLNIRDIPPREMILSPIIPERSINQVTGFRGTGKTWFGLSMAWAIATGGNFLKWTAPKPRRVIYVDGEMDLSELKERTVAIALGMGNSPPGRFKLWTPGIADVMPNLSSPEGQDEVEERLAAGDVLFIDSISTLCRSGMENDEASWASMQEWLIHLKQNRVSSILLHHTGWGKNHGRGTSKREDALQTNILLKEPEAPGDGVTTIEVHLSKKRGVPPADAMPIEASFFLREGALQWTWRDLQDARAQMIREMAESGMTQRQIARELGIGLGTVNRALNQEARREA